MPLYRCVVPSRAVPMDRRQEIARAVTTAHCDATGAPPQFVHVFFIDLPDSDEAPVMVSGSIRAGRSEAQKQQITTDVQAAFERLAGVPRARTRVDLTDVPASWLMEGGRLMPEPGEEAEWMKNH